MRGTCRGSSRGSRRPTAKSRRRSFCKNLAGGATITDPSRRIRDESRGRIRIQCRYPPESVAAVTPEFEQTLWRWMALSKRASQLLRTQNSRMIHKLMYSVVVGLLSVLDSLEKALQDSDRTARIEEALATAPLLGFVVTLTAGGSGAIVSAMARLSRRSDFNYLAKHGSLRMLGGFRPILAALSERPPTCSSRGAR